MNIRLPKLYNWMHRLDSWWQSSYGAGGAPAQNGHPAPTANPPPAPQPPAPSPARLGNVVLSEGVAATLFDDYAAHRLSARAAEEIGWVLLGLRRDADALALAALPAGAERDASSVHVRFNANAQAVASRILRQSDKRLQIVGVVHTHPGDMCEPSSGDLEGDSAWVKNLRHGDAVFGIGTASSDLRFSWYALGTGDVAYRPLRARVEAGADLAAPLRPLWDTLEANAEALEKLCRLFARVQFDAAEGGLAVKIALPEPQNGLRLLLKGSAVRYYWERGGEVIAVDPREPHLERAVLVILAELMQHQPDRLREMPTLARSQS